MGLNKPFNPLLGETFEIYEDGKFYFIGEQVSHHPPVSAFHIIGDSGYKKYGTFNSKTSFGVGTMSFSNIFNEYIDIDEHGEKFEFEPPCLSFHNLVVGTPYIDIEGTGTLRDLKNPDKLATIKFHKRGWTSQENNFKVEGFIYRNKDDLAFTFTGKWNDKIILTDCATGETEVVWQKKPYPEDWQFMYGMTYHGLQMNHLTKKLKEQIPHTDSRLRPD